jgi:CO dehydrogenase/acetyl-CoA synthase gamma subunit (corrinoid Fe-S protein)
MNRCKECSKEAVTYCDECNEPTCRACARIVVEKQTDVDVKIYHKGKCVPKKFRKEVKA